MKLKIELEISGDDPARSMATCLRKIENELLNKGSEFRLSLNSGLRDRYRIRGCGWAECNYEGNTTT